MNRKLLPLGIVELEAFRGHSRVLGRIDPSGVPAHDDVELFEQLERSGAAVRKIEGQRDARAGEGEDARRRRVTEDENAPASYVRWCDAARFCMKLTKLAGKTYRLPTEAEWEYGCRAGTDARADAHFGRHVETE